MIKVIFLIFILLIILYLYLIAPKVIKKADFSKFNGWFYAHRGLHNNKSDAPENSLKAFSLAVQNNYGIELDVQLTKDSIPVVFHDDNLKRVCGVNKKVKNLTLKELKTYHLFQSKEKIPTLNEALDVIDGKVPLVLEYKSTNTSTLIYKIVSNRMELYRGIYCIESFNPFCLIWYKKHVPQIIRGQLSSRFIKESEIHNAVVYFMLKNLMFNFMAKPDFIAYKFKDKKMLSLRLCRRLYGAKTFAWTIRSEKDYDSCKSDFDYFIFDSFHMK